MTGQCKALDLYDPEVEGLSEWGRQLRDESSPLVNELSQAGPLDDRFREFCERYDVPPKARERLPSRTFGLVEFRRSEIDVPGRCPHEALPDTDRCPFHLPPSEYEEHGLTSEEVTERFVRRIHEYVDDPVRHSTRDNKCFANAEFDRLDLRYRAIDSADTYPVNLQFASVGTLRLDEASVEDTVQLDAAEVGSLSADRAHFVLDVSCTGATFGGQTVSFERAKFSGARVDFTDATFRTQTVSFERADFDGADLLLQRANFEMAEARGNTDERRISFRRVTVDGADATFEAARFGRSDLDVSYRGEVRPGESVTVTVEYHGRPVAGATVSLNGGTIPRKQGETDGRGEVPVSLPEVESVPGVDDVTSFDVTATFGELSGETGLDGTASRRSANDVSAELDRFSVKGGDAVFKYLKAFCEFSLDYATLDGKDIDFTDAEFYDGATFKNTGFHCDSLEFNGGEFLGPRATFVGGKFVCESVDFSTARFDTSVVDFSGATFAGGSVQMELDSVDADLVDFSTVTFEGDDVTFDGAEFRADVVTFEDAKLDCGDFSFVESVFETPKVVFSHLDSQAHRIMFVRTHVTGTVDMEEAELNAGRIEQPRDHDRRTAYELEDATVGDVTLADAADSPMFDAFRFLNTDFSGFSFTHHNQALAESDWVIHPGLGDDPDRSRWRGNRSYRTRLAETLSLYARLVGEGAHPDPDLDPSDLESTYRKAKKGADEDGDIKAASEFFKRELFYRRKKYGQEAWDDGQGTTKRLRAARRWVYNFFLGSVTGYGEEPRRVLAWSVGIITMFLFIYEVLWLLIPEQPSVSYRGTLGSAILSLESFTTLVLGGGNVQPLVVRLFGYVEGFIGAFLIALFVFTLTRSVRH